MEHIITDDQINTLWIRRSFYKGFALVAIDDVLEPIIHRCKTCDGSGQTTTRVNVTNLWKRKCPCCKGKKWVVKNDRR